ncbi:hypothetical protein ACI78V_09570 [Geodermatophilus sp. SYSU D00742]
MSIRIIESNLVGAGAECADVIVDSPGVVGIVDGATAKPWDAPDGPTGQRIAAELADLLRGMPPDIAAGDAVARLTDHVATILRGSSIAPGEGSAAALAVVHLGARQVWRVGEANVLIDGQVVPARTRGEGVVAQARALVLHALLADGVPVEDLRREDQGRAAVYGVLRSLVGIRNREVSDYVNAAIDGRPVPEGFLDVVDLPAHACEVVITSDGYPEPAPTLAEAEAGLRTRLDRDPLLIEEPPATKGWMIGRASFDDRAYVRFAVPAVQRGGTC